MASFVLVVDVLIVLAILVLLAGFSERVPTIISTTLALFVFIITLLVLLTA